jgi:hypothetical protein
MKKTLVIMFILLIFNNLGIVAQCKPFIENVSKNDVRCFGSADGALSINFIPNAALPMDITIKDSLGRKISQFAGAANLVASTYQILVVDANGCKDSAKVTINQPLPFKIAFKLLTCDNGSGNATGQLIDGNTGKPFPFAWSSDSNGIVKNLKSTNTYSYTVTNAMGCNYNSIISYIPRCKAQCPPIIKNIDVRNANCFGFRDGQIIVYNSPEARPPFLFTLKDSLGRDAALPTSNSVFSQLPANNYHIIMKDSMGCYDTTTVKITQPNKRVFEFLTIKCDDGTGNGTGKLIDKTTGMAYSWSGQNSDTIWTNLKATITTKVTISDGTCFQVDSFLVKRCIIRDAVEDIGITLKIYPNPFTETLTIESSDIMMRVEVADILGRTIVAQKMNSAYKAIPLSILEKGVYILKIYTDKGIVLRKIMKE